MQDVSQDKLHEQQGFELVTHERDKEVGSFHRWYLKMHSVSMDKLDIFDTQYTLAATSAFKNKWRRRLYVDLTEQKTAVGPMILWRVGQIILKNRPMTAEVYESVCILVPAQDSFVTTAIKAVVNMIPNYSAPLVVFKDKRVALAYHQSQAKPMNGVLFMN